MRSAARDEVTRRPLPLPAAWSQIDVRGRSYGRMAIRTPWLTPPVELGHAVSGAVTGLVSPGDTVIVSEKIAILLTGRAIDARRVRVGRLARFLASHVQPLGRSRGLSMPEKMQYVINHIGRARIVVAALAAALTRPVGRHGDFYRIAGPLARGLDGMRPPYEGLLLPPLPRRIARELASELERLVGTGVAIVDINDRGGAIRAVSPAALSPRLLLNALADNPLGQRLTSTPVVIVRPVAEPAAPRRRWRP